MSQPPERTVLVISHTHWDREWYQPAARFRQRLVQLIDELLDSPPDEHPFLLDGQAIVLEDYLAVRPDRRRLLAGRLASGSLEAGPWYVLGDELIPAGEVLVRNLQAGIRLVRSSGGEPPPVIYSPDAFGHPAALPAIAAGFGFALTVVWRGLGGEGWPRANTLWWSAPDANKSLVYHLPREGYESGANLPADTKAARERWNRTAGELERRSGAGILLLFNGADHHAPQRSIGESVAALSEAAAPVSVRRAGLSDAARTLVQAATGVQLPEISGELRSSPGHTWSLQGTLATRAWLKRRVARAPRDLVRDVEPWLALARGAQNAPALSLEQAAWRELLRCLPHDTICGCSTDEVARAAASRLDSAEAQAKGLREDAVAALAGADPDTSRENSAEWRPAVVVRNRSARARAGVTELRLLEILARVPVGPGSGDGPLEISQERPLRLGDGEVAYQVISRRIRHERVEPRRDYPLDFLVSEIDAVAWIDQPVPGYSLRAVPLTHGDPATPTGEVTAGERWVANELVRLEVDGDGRLVVTSSVDGWKARTTLGLEDDGDIGDSYTPSIVGPTVSQDRVSSARLAHGGPLRAVLQAEFELDLPEAATGSERDSATVPHVVQVEAVVDAGAPFVKLKITGNNRSRDHRLRLVARTGITSAQLHADAAFGPVAREILAAGGSQAQWKDERTLSTAPLHRYVTLSDERRGVTIISDGLAEYEANAVGEIYITLLRSIGELSRRDLPERPGHAGWPVPIPEAQCMGPWEAILAIFPHGARDERQISAIERAAEGVLLPLTGGTVLHLLDLPGDVGGVELSGDGLAFSACKRSEDGLWMVLRCVNLLDTPVTGAWRVAAGITEARAARLDETPGQILKHSADSVGFTAGPRGIHTILVR